MKEGRLLKTGIAEYVQAEFDTDKGNQSGFTPIGNRVLVLTDQVSKMTSGGIELPVDVVERHQMAAETGVIVSVGSGAFKRFQDGSVWAGDTPKPGDQCYMERYSGIVIYGVDGLNYRLMDDTCIGAVRNSTVMVTALGPIESAA